MEEKKCLIISGGEKGKINISPDDYELIIACDKGLDNARALGIRADVAIGDFDSIEGAMPDPETEIIRFPKKKDDSDTMLAAREAVKRGFKNVTICCALGGRMDHLIANLQTLKWLSENKVTAFIIEEKEKMIAFSNSGIRLSKDFEFTLSVFSLSDESRGVTIKGTEYEGEDLVISNAFPIGLSNEWKDEEVSIEVKDGTLLVVCSKK